MTPTHPTVAPTPQSTAAPARPRARRTEIQALRAVAVASVLAFHLWPGAVPGGFVGVDVFFAISGFLITGHLWREVERTGRVRLGTFWARRATRLLPASLLVLALVALGAAAWMPPVLGRDTFVQIGASALYVQNWVLAADSVDYMAADNIPTAVQHYWSLSVEEQFYIALPLIVVACALLAARCRLPARRVVAGAVGLAAAASLVYSVALTTSSPPSAYFVTPTRAWEFAAGGLLALVGHRIRAGGAVRTAASWAGIAAIAVAVFAYGPATPFPGWRAALPVGGALAVMWAGRRAGRVGTAGWMELRGVQVLGDVSYSAYLWHWPLLVLAPFALGRELNGVDRWVVLALSLAAAWVSLHLVEDPVRFSPRLLAGRRPRLVAAWAAGGMALLVATAAAGVAQVDREIGDSLAYAHRLLAENPRCFGAQAMAEDCRNLALTGSIVPDPDMVAQDGQGGCWTSVGSSELTMCTFGPTAGGSSPRPTGTRPASTLATSGPPTDSAATGSTSRAEAAGNSAAASPHRMLRIAAIGDSHTNQYLPALQRIAEQRGWQIDTMGKFGCYFSDADQLFDVPRYARECAEWKDNVRAHLAKTQPYDAILVTHAADATVRVPAGSTQRQAVVDGLVGAWAPLAEQGTVILALRDNPRMPDGIARCVQHHRTDPDRCAAPRAEVLAPDGTAEAVARVPGARMLDLSDLYCTDTTCPPVIGNVAVYRNESHITATFVATLVPYLGEQMARALAHRP